MALLLSSDVWVEICDWAGNARCCNALSLVCRDLWGLLHKRHQYGIRRQLDPHTTRQWVKWCGNEVSSLLGIPDSCTLGHILVTSLYLRTFEPCWMKRQQS